MLDKDSNTPLYLQLIDELIYEIENNIGENGKLYSERDICLRYNVSRTTVRQALSELERDGYIYKKHGKGTFVSPNRMSQDLQGFYSFTKEMEKLGKAPSSKVLKFEILAANNQLITMMKLKEDDLAYKFTRVRLADDIPMIVETTYVPYELFPGITRSDLNKTPLYDILFQKFNETIEYANETYLPVLANEHEAEILGIEVGSPCLKITRSTFNKDNLIIEYTVSIARGDKFKYNIQLKNK